MFRYKHNNRLEITLRHLRGETAVDLAREFNVSERQIRRWKHLAVCAIEERLNMNRSVVRHPTTWYAYKLAMGKVYQDIKDWKPDFKNLDSIMIPETMDPKPKAR
jgi:Helix-turn-helix domain